MTFNLDGTQIKSSWQACMFGVVEAIGNWNSGEKPETGQEVEE